MGGLVQVGLTSAAAARVELARVRHLTATGDVDGEYVVVKELPDGPLVIRVDTYAEAIRRRAGLEQVGAEEFGEHFGEIATDEEG